MSLISRLISFFTFTSDGDEIYTLKKRVLELELKVLFHANEHLENQKIIAKISEILAQLADDQSVLAAELFRSRDKKDIYKDTLGVLSDEDDDLIN